MTGVFFIHSFINKCLLVHFRLISSFHRLIPLLKRILPSSEWGECFNDTKEKINVLMLYIK